MKKNLFVLFVASAVLCLSACNNAANGSSVHTHNYGNPIPEVSATCTEAGTKEHYICDECGEIFVKEGENYVEVTEEDLVIPAKGHGQLEHHEAVEAGYYEPGTIEYWSCPDCGEKFSDANGANPVANVETEKKTLKSETSALSATSSATLSLFDAAKFSNIDQTAVKYVTINQKEAVYVSNLTRNDNAVSTFGFAFEARTFAGFEFSYRLVNTSDAAPVMKVGETPLNNISFGKDGAWHTISAFQDVQNATDLVIGMSEFVGEMVIADAKIYARVAEVPAGLEPGVKEHIVDVEGNKYEMVDGALVPAGDLIIPANKVLVKFVNYDGTELSSTEYDINAMPVAPVENPTRPDNDVYTYTFAGWDKEIVPATESVTYVATYTREVVFTKYVPEGREYDLIQDFESAVAVGYSNGSTSEFVETDVITGSKAYKFMAAGWGMFTARMLKSGAPYTAAQFRQYEKIQIHINSDASADFYFGNKAVWLTAGDNTVSITGEEFATIVETPNSPAFYDVEGCFIFQIGANVTITVDSLVGIYPEGYEKDPYIPNDRAYDMLNDFETDAMKGHADITWISDQHVKTGEHSLKVDSSPYTWVENRIPLLKDGQALTRDQFAKYEAIKMSIYLAGDPTGTPELYMLNYSFALAKGQNDIVIPISTFLAQLDANASSYVDGKFWFQSNPGELYLDSIIGVYPEGYDLDAEEPVVDNYLPADRAYDMLNDFETDAVKGHADITWISDQHVRTGEHSLKVNSGSYSWVENRIPLLKDGQALTRAQFAKYESIKMSIYLEGDPAGTPELYMLNSPITLAKGQNDVIIPIATFLEQFDANASSYVDGKFWFQSNPGELYIDSILGVYPQDTMFQDFEGSGVVWSNATVTYVEEHATTGSKAAKIVGADSWTMATVKMCKSDSTPLTAADIEKYDSFTLNVYSETACDFYFARKAIWVNAGANKISVSKADFLTLFEDAQSPANYDVEGCLLIQIAPGATFYLDSLVGVVAKN